MMAITIFMPRAPDSDKHKSTSVNSKGILLHHSMENWILLMYKTASVLRRARGIKNGAGPVKGPRRRDIAPTGELAGRREMLLNRQELWPRSKAGRAFRNPPKKSLIQRRGIKSHPGRFHPSAHAAPVPIRAPKLSHRLLFPSSPRCKPPPAPAQRWNRRPPARSWPWAGIRSGIRRLDIVPRARVGGRSLVLRLP